jgi:hypothetical protein
MVWWVCWTVYAVLTEEGMALLERAAPDHVGLVRELLFDALTPDQVRALADGLGEASRRMADGLGEASRRMADGPGEASRPTADGPGEASRPTADDKDCPASGSETAADLST